MKFNWLMVLPFALFLGIAGIWLWQLQNNQFALQQGVDTTALRSVQEGNPAPDLDLDPLGPEGGPGLDEQVDRVVRRAARGRAVGGEEGHTVPAL